MSCMHCGAPSPNEQIELDRMTYAVAYKAGFTDAAGLGAAHPAVVDSVKRVFAGWDGLDAAREASVTKFKAWHQQTRKEAA